MIRAEWIGFTYQIISGDTRLIPSYGLGFVLGVCARDVSTLYRGIVRGHVSGAGVDHLSLLEFLTLGNSHMTDVTVR